ncbi:MAG: transposase family protein [Cyclobacteriaceae bacterium]
MKDVNNILYLTFTDLRQYGFTDNFLFKVTSEARSGKRKTYQNIPGEGKNRCLIAFDSIPEETRTLKGLPTKDELLKQLNNDKLGNLITKDSKALEYFLNNPDTYQRADDLQEIAAWLMAVAPFTLKAVKPMGYTSVDGFYADCLTQMNKINSWDTQAVQRFKRRKTPFYKYFKSHPDHFNPASPKYHINLTELPEPYLAALDSLNNCGMRGAQMGNANAGKLKDRSGDKRAKRQAEEMQSRLIVLYKDGKKKLNINQTWLAYGQTATERHKLWLQEEKQGLPVAHRRGWDEKCIITEAAIKDWLYQDEIKPLWYAERYGKNLYHDQFIPSIHRRPVSGANIKWVIDGVQFNVYFQKDGYKYQRLYGFVVMDEYSYAIVGYAIGFSETQFLVTEALRNACRNVGYLPDQITSDHSKAIKSWHSQQCLNQICTHFTPAEPRMPRAKKIEAAFAHFNDQSLKLIFTAYTGNPQAKSLDRQPNKDVLELVANNKLEIENHQEALVKIQTCMELWNNHKFNNAYPMQKFQNSLKQTKSTLPQFTDTLDVEAFWYQPVDKRIIKAPARSTQKTQTIYEPRTYTYSNLGLQVEDKHISEERTWFSVDDDQWISQNQGGQFQLKVNPDNFAEAYLYQNDRPVMGSDGNRLVAKETYKLASAIRDMQPGEREVIDKKRKQQKTIAANHTAGLDRYLQIAKEANLQEAAIDACTVYGKKITNNGKALAAEGMVNRYDTDAKKPVTETITEPDTDENELTEHNDAELIEVSLNRFEV